MTSTKTFKKTPPVFSFQRTVLVTDGAFFNLIDGSYKNHPLSVIRHGIRGTQNVKEKGDSAKSGERDSPSNIQQTESAKTSHDAQGAVVTFDLRMIDLKHALFACAAEDVVQTNEVRASVMGFVERAKSSQGLDEVARRIARNVANGSWLWRNRVIASHVTVEVLHNDKLVAEFNALAVPTDHFDNYSTGENAVAAILADGLRGNRQANLHVRATLDFGVKGSVEVFPSQAYIEDKPKGFARPLYKINLVHERRAEIDPTDAVRVLGQAALRDQKISNRLRTIDTWYEDYAIVGKPIPVEPNGASLEFMQFFRRANKKTSAFSMFARLNEIQPDTEEGMFCIAAMMRGGVYGEKADKAEKAGKAKADNGDAGTTAEAE